MLEKLVGKMSLDILFEGFNSADWQTCLDSRHDSADEFVYVLTVRREDQQIPFYVGQTKSLQKRMWDYKQKYFTASTDFRVGEAIAYIAAQENCEIVVKYKGYKNSKSEEKRPIRDLQLLGLRLLNNFGGYDYAVCNPETERAAIHSFCKMALSHVG